MVVLKFVTCLQILLLLNKRSIVHFCEWKVITLVIFCGCHKCMTHKWFKTTPNSIIRGINFFSSSSHKPCTFWLRREQPPAPPPTHPFHHSIDEQTKVPVTFNWHLIFYVRKYFSLLNIASLLASNKPLWTRKCNRCS